MDDLATLQGWLTDAQTARHKLVTGGLRQTVRYNGQQEVTYARTDIAGLDAYIANLQARIGALQGDSRARMRPLNFTF